MPDPGQQHPVPFTTLSLVTCLKSLTSTCQAIRQTNPKISNINFFAKSQKHLHQNGTTVTWGICAQVWQHTATAARQLLI